MKYYIFKRYIKNDLLQKKQIHLYISESKSWFLNDKCHREDGPAYEGVGGIKGWYLEGNNYSKELDYLSALEKYKRENKKIGNFL